MRTDAVFLGFNKAFDQVRIMLDNIAKQNIKDTGKLVRQIKDYFTKRKIEVKAI